MSFPISQDASDRLAEVRESPSGRSFTDPQFEEAGMIGWIMKRHIRRSDAFTEKLVDYAHAFARTEKTFDTAKGEILIREVFKALTGQSMNQMRENLAENEKKLTPDQKLKGHDRAIAVGDMIEKGVKMSFNRAFAHQGQLLAEELDITHAGAKRLMKDEFKAAHGKEFYDWAKEIEEKFYRPQIEAEKQQREEQASTRENERSRPQSRMQYRR